MSKLAESMNQASREIDAVLAPDVSVTRSAPELSPRLHDLAIELSALHHSA
jgi:hypothetical protein